MKRKFPRLVVVMIAAMVSALFGSAVASADNSSAGERVILSGGLSHSLALKEDGTVRAWGANKSGQLGDGKTTLRKVIGEVGGSLNNVVAVSSGNLHSLALKADGTVWAWGSNASGQLGDGTKVLKKTPVQVKNLTSVTAIAANGNFSLALKSDGTVWAWGLNSGGQLGDGTKLLRLLPVKVSGVSNVKAISAGATFALAVTNGGRVYAWGSNGYGQLGDGTKTLRTTPVLLGISNVKQVATGFNFSIALLNTGSVMSWGLNAAGQLGDGTLTQRLSPVFVSGLNDATEIEAGKFHAIALKANGTVVGWGQNTLYQLGDGTKVNKKVPVQVKNLTGAVQIAAGQNHNLALKNDGYVAAWGQNTSGQLGDGTATVRSTPVNVGGLNIQLPDVPVTEEPGGGEPGDEEPPAEEPPVDNSLQLATDAVNAAQQLANGDLSNQALIENANQAYTTADELVAALVDGPDKDSLRGQLDGILQQILSAQNLLNAAAAVANAELAAAGDLSQASVLAGAQLQYSAASSLVGALPDNAAKSNLQARLDAVQTQLAEAQAVLNATNAVVAAEQASLNLGSQGQIDAAQQLHGAAQSLVGTLPDNAAKAGLQARLDAVQASINQAQILLNASNAVVAAEQAALVMLTQDQIDNAQLLHGAALSPVGILPDGDVKAGLQARLDAVQARIADAQALLNATNAVVSAEQATASMTTQEAIDAAQQHHDSAQDLVGSLVDGEAKAALQARLDAVQSKIAEAQAVLNATNAVIAAEQAAATMLTQDQIDAAQLAHDDAQSLVGALTAGDAQTGLQVRLDAIVAKIAEAQALLNATNAVIAAEQSAALMVEQVQIDAAQQAHDSALSLVGGLTEGEAKAALQARLSSVQENIVNAQLLYNATQAVTEAELATAEMLDQAQIDAAQQAHDSAGSLVAALVESDGKTAIQARLDAMQTKINHAQALLNAKIAVAAAEQAAVDLGTQVQIDAAQQAYDAAIALVNGLIPTAASDELKQRMEVVRLQLLEGQAKLDVQTAESTRNQADIDRAGASADRLPEGPLKDSIKARLDVLQKSVDAEAILNQILASDYKTFAEIDAAIGELYTARDLIAALPAGADKTRLEALYKKAEDKLFKNLVKVLVSKVLKPGKSERLTDRTIEFFVKYVIRMVGAKSQLDRGKIQGYAMPILGGHATGADLNKLIDKWLPKKK